MQTARRGIGQGIPNGLTIHPPLVAAYIACTRMSTNVFSTVDLSVNSLVKAERESRQGYDMFRDLTHYEIRLMQPATIADIGGSMREQLVVLVEWAKQIPLFNQKLDLEDQVIMLNLFFKKLDDNDFQS